MIMANDRGGKKLHGWRFVVSMIKLSHRLKSSGEGCASTLARSHGQTANFPRPPERDHEFVGNVQCDQLHEAT